MESLAARPRFKRSPKGLESFSPSFMRASFFLSQRSFAKDPTTKFQNKSVPASDSCWADTLQGHTQERFGKYTCLRTKSRFNLENREITHSIGSEALTKSIGI